MLLAPKGESRPRGVGVSVPSASAFSPPPVDLPGFALRGIEALQVGRAASRPRSHRHAKINSLPTESKVPDFDLPQLAALGS